jgi:hypothetical protein
MHLQRFQIIQRRVPISVEYILAKTFGDAILDLATRLLAQQFSCFSAKNKTHL